MTHLLRIFQFHFHPIFMLLQLHPLTLDLHILPGPRSVKLNYVPLHIQEESVYLILFMLSFLLQLFQDLPFGGENVRLCGGYFACRAVTCNPSLLPPPPHHMYFSIWNGPLSVLHHIIVIYSNR